MYQLVHPLHSRSPKNRLYTTGLKQFTESPGLNRNTVQGGKHMLFAVQKIYCKKSYLPLELLFI